MRAIAMKCPGCGAALEVSLTVESFNCGYCGIAARVVREGGTVTLVTEALTRIQVGTDRTAAELALVRLKPELHTIQDQIAKLRQLPWPVMPEVPMPPPHPVRNLNLYWATAFLLIPALTMWNGGWDWVAIGGIVILAFSIVSIVEMIHFFDVQLYEHELGKRGTREIRDRYHEEVQIFRDTTERMERTLPELIAREADLIEQIAINQEMVTRRPATSNGPGAV